MFEVITDMPTGTIGFKASGKLTADDYRKVLEPVLAASLEKGDVRMLFVIDDDLELEMGALKEDAKTGLSALKKRSALKKTAIVSDADWVAKGIRAFAWMIPGEVKVWDDDDREDVNEAKLWLVTD